MPEISTVPPVAGLIPCGASVTIVTTLLVRTAPTGPGAASANITATGPHLAPTSENLTFVDQGGWKLSHDSAMTLIQSVRSSGH